MKSAESEHLRRHMCATYYGAQFERFDVQGRRDYLA